MKLYKFEGIQQSSGEIALYTHTEGMIKSNIIIKVDNKTGIIKNTYVTNYEDKELLSNILYTEEPTGINAYSLVDLLLNKSVDEKDLGTIIKSAFNYLFTNTSFRLYEDLYEQLTVFRDLSCYKSPIDELQIPKYYCKDLYKLINFSRMNFTINTMTNDSLNKLDYVFKDLALGGSVTKVWTLDVKKNFEVWEKVNKYPNYSPIKLALSTIDPIAVDCEIVSEKIKFNSENYIDYFELGTGLKVGENISKDYLDSEIQKGTDVRKIIETCLAMLDDLNLDILCDNGLNYKDMLNTRILLKLCDEEDVKALIEEYNIRGSILGKVRHYVELGFNLKLFLVKGLNLTKLDRIISTNSRTDLKYSSNFDKKEKTLAFEYLRKKGIDCNEFKHLNNNKLETIIKFRNPEMGRFIDKTSDTEFLLIAEILQQAPNLLDSLKDLDISEDELRYIREIPKDNETYYVLERILNSQCCRDIRISLLSQLYAGNKDLNVLTFADNYDVYELYKKFGEDGVLTRVAVYGDSKTANMVFNIEDCSEDRVIMGYTINKNYRFIDTLVSYRESGGFTDYVDYSMLYETLLLKL